ncbi:type II toxin-antitoxin system RelE/ParE family toxin [Candidatus Bipolaricaulota bacterium]|nr:type II toxin-antitoxin system RelE/ParE family toxin [Candidatus Bipolaricaulota bacterium]
MARYSLRFKKSVSKDLLSIPKQDVRRILNRIDALADNPRPAGAEKLSTQDLYRIRQESGQGETSCLSQRTGRCRPVRILYETQDDRLIIVVVKIGKRSDVYR